MQNSPCNPGATHSPKLDADGMCIICDDFRAVTPSKPSWQQYQDGMRARAERGELTIQQKVVEDDFDFSMKLTLGLIFLAIIGFPAVIILGV